MQLRQQMTHASDDGSDDDDDDDDIDEDEDVPPPPKMKPSSAPPVPSTPVGSVSLETAEQLSSKIIKLQQRVEELEDIMVYTKLDNAQLRETVDFLKSKLKQYTKKPSTEKKSTAKAPSVRNLFSRK